MEPSHPTEGETAAVRGDFMQGVTLTGVTEPMRNSPRCSGGARAKKEEVRGERFR